MLEGVLKGCMSIRRFRGERVSILGMLEGVLKATPNCGPAAYFPVSILGMLEGVLKAPDSPNVGSTGSSFQSLVCWRGC